LRRRHITADSHAVLRAGAPHGARRATHWWQLDYARGAAGPALANEVDYRGCGAGSACPGALAEAASADRRTTSEGTCADGGTAGDGTCAHGGRLGGGAGASNGAARSGTGLDCCAASCDAGANGCAVDYSRLRTCRRTTTDHRRHRRLSCPGCGCGGPRSGRRRRGRSRSRSGWRRCSGRGRRRLLGRGGADGAMRGSW
jgi:hypothetical protein